MLRFNSILFFLAGFSSVVNTLHFIAYKDKDCLEEDEGNSIWDGRIDPLRGCSVVTGERPTTAFKVADYGSWSSCKVNLMHANDSTHIYDLAHTTPCHWGSLGEDWIRESKNGTCYQYSEWDRYALDDCDDSVFEEWRQDLAFKGKSMRTITIVGPVVGSVVGLLLILSVVYWRRQKKRERTLRHGKVEEIQLTHRIRP